MAKKRKGSPVHGWVNFYKPVGMTSTQAVGKIRYLLNAQKAGHAGTLDPLAEGVLPIALGEATKTVPYIQDAQKIYRFTITWGENRTTEDREGDITDRSDVRPDKQQILNALPAFIGEISQIPPHFSAVKIDGARAYDLARAGHDFEIKPRTVRIDALDLLETTPDSATMRMTCGKGTYVRSLSRDLAKNLGTCGYISLLVREKVGTFIQENTISLDILEKLDHSAALNQALCPLEQALDDIPALQITNDNDFARLRNGNALSWVSRAEVERFHQAGIDPKFCSLALAKYNDMPVALVRIEKAQIIAVKVFNIEH